MHLPIEITLGSQTFHLHQFFEVAGMFLGFRLFLHLRKNSTDPLSQSDRLLVLVGATLGALLGARLLASLENPNLWFSEDTSWWQLFSNKTLVGGLLGGLIGVELAKWWKGIKTSSGDLFVFPLLLAMFIGRMGCFSMGVLEDTYGVASSLPWAMDLGDGVLRHPVTLYEMLYLCLMAASIYMIEKKGKLENGYRFKLFMIAYLAFRLALDFIKPTNPLLLGISAIQWACVIGLVYYTKSIYKLVFQVKSLRIS
jgi:prolipoprotein diacylglyceryltransferase